MRKWWFSFLAALMMTSVFTWDMNQTSAASGQGIVQEAHNYMGTPYSFGGDTPAAFDCSGFVQHVYEQFGIDLPRTSRDQANAGTYVAKSDLRPGDIVFYQGTWRDGVSHNGIYIGNNQMIHASRSRGVSVVSLDNSYWAPKYHSARRIISGSSQEVAGVQESFEELPAGQYHDVASNHWAHGAIQELGESGVIAGHSNWHFLPNDSISRAEAAALLNRQLKLGSGGSLPFNDVSSSTFASGDIASVTAAGVMGGYEDGSFRPTEPITRAEIATMFDRAFNWKTTPSGNASFSDVSSSSWAAPHISRLASIDQVSGYEDGTFRPDQNMTRAEFASVLHRAIHQ
ncbi:C40 family peptidase [Alkalicoccus urumqiensis]|uniref:C40 family peptidase n=1 Tax=Alkalicoccus urumqiensis TaxID=1548213 RepID=UPI0015E5AAF8|nr:C40 family peptidase [Alkalicoccus urumqiensis]